MKIKLLLSLLTTSFIGFAQHQVNSFYGSTGFACKGVVAATPPDHGAGGINQTWTFSGFLPVTPTTYYIYGFPGGSQATTYPGTNYVITTIQGSDTVTGNMFTKNTSGTVSITGIDSAGLNINFNGGTGGAGNATLGAFPMVYPFTNTDNTVSGSFNYGTNSGTFSGSLTTTVDGWGVLNLTDYGFTANVTRLKTVLSVTLYVSIFPVGTATQTTYAYYNPTESTNNFKFRSVNTIIQASAAGIDENNTTYEIANSAMLGNADNIMQSVWIKNPVQNTIEINTSTNIDNANVSITDMLGKTIYQAKNQIISGTLEIPVLLTKGVYLITIGNENGTVTKKIIKS